MRTRGIDQQKAKATVKSLSFLQTPSGVYVVNELVKGQEITAKEIAKRTGATESRARGWLTKLHKLRLVSKTGRKFPSDPYKYKGNKKLKIILDLVQEIHSVLNS